eukprot:comp16305_c0_seq2/m.14081 comp16305_c0_seq2/g.14081  ORF comp16305_c0_seq2/g.14081 comp16305_c0_seq2/m.14081 type:complete len:504 (-) comp16305_c0_seq2:810-2321(-)
MEERGLKDVEAPVIYPIIPPTPTLSVYRPLEGWNDVCTVPGTSEGLSISRGGKGVVWRVMENVVPEEAERGEYWLVELEKGAVPRQLTKGAGRVGLCRLSPDCTHVVYCANYSRERPITTHTDLWALPFRQDGHDVPLRLTQDEVSVEDFDWTGDPTDSLLWVSTIRGTERVSEIISAVEPAANRKRIEPSIKHHVCWNNGTPFAYATESISEFVSLWVDGRRIDLPHPEGFDDFVVEKVHWQSDDGLDITGLLCSLRDTPPTSTLLVHVHGGPAVAFAEDRSISANSTRYPYRHLLGAGYRILQPMYRGTLGFGDVFAQANIRRQGFLESGDLGDILAGIDYLLESGKVECSTRLGVFGGSFGGFMTIRSLATTNRFKAGVAMYGFVHLRWMSYEGGDFTWEDEYCGERVWPLPEENTTSDNFPHLGKITAPTLFLHGTDDDICPFSQSAVAFRALHTREVPTGLIAYPGEKHGFVKKENRRDRDRRVLAWFLEFLPPTDLE